MPPCPQRQVVGSFLSACRSACRLCGRNCFPVVRDFADRRPVFPFTCRLVHGTGSRCCFCVPCSLERAWIFYIDYDGCAGFHSGRISGSGCSGRRLLLANCFFHPSSAHSAFFGYLRDSCRLQFFSLLPGSPAPGWGTSCRVPVQFTAFPAKQFQQHEFCQTGSGFCFSHCRPVVLAGVLLRPLEILGPERRCTAAMKRSCWQRPLFRLLVLLYVLPCAALLLPFAKAGILSLWDHSVIPEKSYWASYLNTILLAAGNLLLQWLVNLPAGLALSKMLPRHTARKLLYLCLLLMLLPQQALILPQYLLLDRIHLCTTRAVSCLCLLSSLFWFCCSGLAVSKSIPACSKLLSVKVPLPGNAFSGSIFPCFPPIYWRAACCRWLRVGIC